MFAQFEQNLWERYRGDEVFMVLKKFSKKQPTIWTFGRLIFRQQSTLKMQFYLIVVSFFVKTFSPHPLLLNSWAATSWFERVCGSDVTHVVLMMCHTEDMMVHIFVSLCRSFHHRPWPLSSSPLICHLAWHAFCLQTNKKI